MDSNTRNTFSSAIQKSTLALEQRPHLRSRSLTAGYRAAPHPPQIQEINFGIAPGEVVAIIGPNGSGKSTLLRALSRTLPPRHGEILLGESDLYAALSPRDSARAIGVVPQSPDIFLDFTVQDIVAMGRAPHRAARGPLAADTPADEVAVASALQHAGITADLAAKPISQVSGGERQRALIARCLAQESPILLLDEPVSALDPHHQRQLLSWLKQLASQHNRTVVVVLHDLNAAAEFAGRIIVLSQGKIVADGTPLAVLTGETIFQVYGVRTWIRSNPATGHISVLPAESLEAIGGIADSMQSGNTQMGRGELSLQGKRVHLFCGASTGVPLMFLLESYGVSMSTCVLHEGDADLDAARSLSVPHALATAFSRPSSDAIDQAQALASVAEAAVFTVMEHGDINGGLFEQAVRFVESGKPLLFLGEGSWSAFINAVSATKLSLHPMIARDCQSIIALLRLQLDS